MYDTLNTIIGINLFAKREFIEKIDTKKQKVYDNEVQIALI